VSKKTASRAVTKDEAAKKIRKARLEINAIDRAIVRQLAFRARIVAKISRIRGVGRRDPRREREVIRNAVRLNGRMTRNSGVGYPDRTIASIFKAILDAGGRSVR
jgi:chorismate mutase